MKQKAQRWKEALQANAQRKKQVKKQRNREAFNKKYNRLNIWQPKQKVNMETFRYLPKELTDYGLSKQALAVYPALCTLADFETWEWIQVSQENLSKMAGVSIPGVAKATRELEMAKLLEMKIQTERTRHFWIYNVEFVRKDEIDLERGKFFAFHTAIVESGIWGDELSQRAKVLYLAMRGEAKFDIDLYAELEYECDAPHEIDFDWHGADFRNRKWDVFVGSLNALCARAGIGRQNLKPVIEQLERFRLVEVVDNYYFKVYLKPKVLKYIVLKLQKP